MGPGGGGLCSLGKLYNKRTEFNWRLTWICRNSLDGGVSWAVSTNSADNMNGIRAASLFNSIRANGFPNWCWQIRRRKERLDLCCNNREDSYTATDVADVILHKSTNQRNNLDFNKKSEPGCSWKWKKFQYMPAVRVDEYGGYKHGLLWYKKHSHKWFSMIYVNRSVDGGSTWSEILVSDHKFIPKPISGLAGGYQGDYIGITSGNGVNLALHRCEDIWILPGMDIFNWHRTDN